ncbi:hypothetical protein AX17_005957 [Amanita inopinata Kibby_2008]|nr:hypothetical protein AX17_005957 [Amanita inopinata Kibby_2008]
MSEETIVATASYQAKLASSISELDDAPGALSQQSSYVAEVETKFEESVKKLQVLAAKTKKAKKVHEGWRDSTARKLAHKLTGQKGKFAARDSKEEREYIEALEREVAEKEAFHVLRQMRLQANQQQEDLSQKVRERQTLKAELSSLYSQIFDDPNTNGVFPDDELKYQVESAERHHEQIQTTLTTECEAADLLNRADSLLNSCREKVCEIVEYTRWDTWAGGSIGDVMERNAVSRAHILAAQVQALVRQAQIVSPSVENVEITTIPQRQVDSL